MEGEGEFHFGHGGEGGPELNRLRRAIEAIVVPGAGRAALERLLVREPQRDKSDNLRYLVTSGMAVELITGFIRLHHDLDLVIMDPTNGKWEVYGTDNVTPQTYWADMEFDPVFLADTAIKTLTRGSRGLVAEVVHPAILLVQKSSNAFDRPPRQKDAQDVTAIVRHWKERERFTKEWNPIIQTSLEALPSPQVRVTLARVREVVKR